jgi:hypothetical protein
VDVSINLDHFRRTPVREVVALLPSQSDAVAACDDLEDAGLEVHGAQILVGDEGVRILDTNGTGHGYAARLSRAMTHFGSAENVLHLHNDGLVGGEALLAVGCDRDAAPAVADVVRGRGGHAIAYFGRGTLESMSPA